MQNKKMYKAWFVLFFLVPTLVSAQVIGDELDDSCELEEAETVIGKCTPLYKCPYAENLINVENKKPTSCLINDKERLVCCPQYNDEYKTGVLGRIFLDSMKGKLTTGDIECRYTGTFPMVCCKRQQINTPPSLDTRFTVKCTDSDRQDMCNACFEFSEQRPYGSLALCPQQSSPKIAFGNAADIQEYPHMTILGCRNKKEHPDDVDIVWIGAGTLISRTWVLTAAHVLYEPTYGNLEFAMLGSTNKTEIKSGILRNVVQRVQYKLYSPARHDHDIALVELNMEVQFSPFARPACLPVRGVIDNSELNIARVAGWGRSGQRKLTTIDLKAGEMTIQMCKNAREFNWDSSIEFCAVASQADTCEGDSGGPLMMDIRNNSICGYYVFGVVAHGDVCGENVQGHYTNVMYKDYLDWISKTVWPNGS